MVSENFVLIPPKETVKAGLATLGLTNENDTLLSSSDLINSSLVKIRYFSPKWRVLMQYIVKCLGSMQGSHDQLNANQQTIAKCLCWGLNVDIASILFSDLIAQQHPVTGKKERKSNICYIRYLSLILEHLLGEAYTNENLKTLKPNHITTLSFKPTLENETALTAHMEVNVDDSADKSSSGTSVQPVTQPKAPTDLKPKKKRIPPSSKPKSSKQVRDVPPKKQVVETQPAEEIVATANATQSIRASKSAED
ncbi:hypothetical protein Tco_1506708 [Tanacetum coccineum]